MALQDTLQKWQENLSEFDVNNIDFNNIGIWPLAGKVAVWAIVFVLVLFLSYQFHLSGLLGTLKTEESKELTLRGEFEKKVNDAANLEEYRAQMIEMEASFEALLKQLPQDTEVPGLIDDISARGLDSGLTFKAIDLKKENVEDYYIELPIEVDVTGGYHDFGTFASGIAGLPRIVTLNDFSIRPAGRKSDKDPVGVGALEMSIMADTYRYRPKDAGSK
jgi:type IV pilus assembly protein PilO